MSFKDDFLEAWRSVKRDFFRDTEYTTPQPTPTQNTLSDTGPVPPIQAKPTQPSQEWQPSHQQTIPPNPNNEDTYAAPELPDDVVFDAFRQASELPGESYKDSYNGFDDQDDEQERYDEESIYADTTPYRDFEPNASEPEYTPMGEDRRATFDQLENGGVFSDEKTIISKNTVIRGALQTADSVRLLGQVLGDIECKSNIVVAGKVRGNTTAANAYIFDAQVDGDVRCDDVINISNDAWILGNIRAQQAEIDGKIKGNIEIRHMVSIGASSSVLGDISADELEIKRGAFVNGQIMMYSPSRDVLDRFDRFDDKQ